MVKWNRSSSASIILAMMLCSMMPALPSIAQDEPRDDPPTCEEQLNTFREAYRIRLAEVAVLRGDSLRLVVRTNALRDSLRVEAAFLDAQLRACRSDKPSWFVRQVTSPPLMMCLGALLWSLTETVGGQ